MSHWKILIFFCLQITFINTVNIEVTFEIPQGKIKGTKTTTVYNDVTYYGFKGIPYSKPKIGENKFDPPELPNKWEGVRDATKHGPECVQYDPIFQSIEGDDDCLLLNVYTPDMNSESCKPVMVWIHGGAFIFGSGNDNIYGPDYLIEHDVVIVTLNYRLGPIGFLNTQDSNAVANLGLKDQSYALRWVRNNIEYFGGCRDNVTIFGESAGSASVHYHLLSPMSRDYFDQSIQQSGSATDEWAFNYYPRKAAFQLGEKLGIQTNDSLTLMKSLKKLDSRDILKVSEDAFEDISLEEILTWVPSVEFPVDGIEIFLTDHPMTLIKSGKVADVPMMAGVNLDECALFIYDVLDHIEKNREYIYKEMHTLLPNNLNVTDVDEAKTIVKEIYNFYFGEKNITHETYTELLDLLNDAAFFIQYHMTTLLTGEHISSPIYKYLLTHRSPEGVLKNFKNLGNVSSHADDLEYLWHWHLFENLPDKNSPTEFFVKLFTKLWTNFAKYGNPTAVQDDIIDFNWQPMGTQNNILNINVKPTMQKGFFPERMNFWIKLYDKTQGGFNKLLKYSYNSASAVRFTFASLLAPCFILMYAFS